MGYINKSSRLSSRRNKNKPLIILLIVFVLTIGIYILSLINIPILSNVSSTAVSFVYSAAATIKGVIFSGFDYFGDVASLKEENEKLKKNIQDLEFKLVEMEALNVENVDLKEALNIDLNYAHYNKTYANIIYRSYDNWSETFVINKGSIDGIKEKQTVISSKGLVGYISSVSDKTAVVTTILDVNSALSVQIATINELAIVKGDYFAKEDGYVKLTNIPVNVELSKGEKIYTSGIGTIYKKGIVLGEIVEVESKKNKVDRYAYINPFTDFNSLSLVAIIIDD